jgi:transcriptional regulator with XRE-family HTH domain
MQRKAGRKLTQAELADAAGVSHQQISRYEAEADEPSYDTWVKLARALMTTPGELMFGIPIEEGQEVPSPRPTRPAKGKRA